MSVGALFLQTSMRQPLWRFKLKAFLKISPHLTGDCFLCLTLLCSAFEKISVDTYHHYIFLSRDTFSGLKL